MLKNALVHRTQSEAIRAVRELGIDARPMGWGAATLGYSFEKIFVLALPRNHVPKDLEWLDHLRQKLAPGASLTLLF